MIPIPLLILFSFISSNSSGVKSVGHITKLILFSAQKSTNFLVVSQLEKSIMTSGFSTSLHSEIFSIHTSKFPSNFVTSCNIFPAVSLSSRHNTTDNCMSFLSSIYFINSFPALPSPHNPIFIVLLNMFYNHFQKNSYPLKNAQSS